MTISETDFERARLAFVEGWTEQDQNLSDLNLKGTPGIRTRAGLKAALMELGIGVAE